jgi:hypothetical protein
MTTAAVMLNYDRARAILGDDFISPEEIGTARGLTYTGEQFANFGDTLPAQDVLKWCRDNGMMLVAGPPKSMTIIDVRFMKPNQFNEYGGVWYATCSYEFIRSDKVEPVWIALRKEPVNSSSNKDWEEQRRLCRLVEPTMEVPNVAEVVWCLTAYRAVRGFNPLPVSSRFRTSSIDESGSHVFVGSWDGGILDVYKCRDFWKEPCLGISASRKF